MIKQPKNKLIKIAAKNGTVIAQTLWKSSFSSNKNADYKKAQIFVDSEVLRLSDPLTPKRNNKLIQSGLQATEIGSGLVQYNAPYARYHYYGKLMIGPAPKKLTDIDMTYEGAPQRGPFWFERMKAINARAILKGAGEIAAGKK